MTNFEFVVVFILVIGGVLLGFWAANQSQQRDPLRGGIPSRIFHQITASIMISLTPTVLTCIIILRIPILQVVGLIVVMVAIALASMMAHAYFEKPAIENYVDEAAKRGWTEEDARTSGL